MKRRDGVSGVRTGRIQNLQCPSSLVINTFAATSREGDKHRRPPRFVPRRGEQYLISFLSSGYRGPPTHCPSLQFTFPASTPFLPILRSTSRAALPASYLLFQPVLDPVNTPSKRSIQHLSHSSPFQTDTYPLSHSLPFQMEIYHLCYPPNFSTSSFPQSHTLTVKPTHLTSQLNPYLLNQLFTLQNVRQPSQQAQVALHINRPSPTLPGRRSSQLPTCLYAYFSATNQQPLSNPVTHPPIPPLSTHANHSPTDKPPSFATYLPTVPPCPPHVTIALSTLHPCPP